MAFRHFLGRWWFNTTSSVRDFTAGHAVTRRRVYDKVDSASFQKKVVAVAGLGFGTDAYDIFALNAIIPILQYVYWPSGVIPASFLTSLYCSTLAGSVIGQLLFGLLGDVMGRRRMYGIVLLVQTVGTIGVAMASRGEYGSMSFEGWLIFWRIWMGIGIGGDYCLSATITSEFSPRKNRRRMLASVFFTQPLGQLLGTLVGMVVIASIKHKIPNRTVNYQDIQDDLSLVNMTCMAMIDGRKQPTLDRGILLDQNALCGVTCGIPSDATAQCYRVLDSAWRWVVGIGAVPVVIGIIARYKIPGTPRWLMDVGGGGVAVESTVNEFYESDELSIYPDEQSSLEMAERPNGDVQAASRRSSNASSNHFNRRVSITDEVPPLPASVSEYLKDWRETFLKDGTWQFLFGTSFCWFLLDVPFYGFQLSYSRIISYIWYNDDNHTQFTTSVYDYLWENLVHQLVVVSIGAILGGVLMIALVQHVSPRRIQFFGFITLAVLLLVTGTAFTHLGKGVIVMYVLCQLSFNLGPNVTTYSIPAELFPTRFRCFSHGISAASGKIGSIVAQLIFAYATFDGFTLQEGNGEHATEWLAKAFLVFFAFAVAGAIVTYFFIPDTTDGKGQSLTLEKLAEGRKALEREHNRFPRWRK